MIPHGGGNTQRDNGFIKPHTWIFARFFSSSCAIARRDFASRGGQLAGLHLHLSCVCPWRVSSCVRWAACVWAGCFRLAEIPCLCAPTSVALEMEAEEISTEPPPFGALATAQSVSITLLVKVQSSSGGRSCVRSGDFDVEPLTREAAFSKGVLRRGQSAPPLHPGMVSLDLTRGTDHA